jgi:hypothetical protein
MNAGDSFRALALLGLGMVLGVCLAVAVQVRADDPVPAEADAAARRCERLAGLERTECERKLIEAEAHAKDEARAKKDRSALEKEEKARAEEEAARASSAADPASDDLDSDRSRGSKVRQAAAPRSDSDPKIEGANEAREPDSDAIENNDTDTLDRPRQ